MTALLTKDKRDLRNNPIPLVDISWPNNDLFHWLLTIQGPPDSLYVDDIFEVTLDFPPGWPTQPPKVQMQTAIFHPNVGSDGSVCVNSVRKAYHKGVTVRAIIEEILDLLRRPNPAERLNIPVAKIMDESMEAFKIEVKRQVASNILAREASGTKPA
jgi:ubiquitin-conjugating enzyme E2 D/E